ncbi:hypothetical protein KGY79_04950 [Candidatus Bipolaricaulota bacterium]|nr:hypothetical protein [Candidatus Bipolaricaulota bacterium]
MELTKDAIAITIDYTFLDPDGTLEYMKKLCQEAIEYNFASVAIALGFIKTSKGSGQEGATVENVELMKKVVVEELKVKAAGGIRTPEDYKEMRSAGASRIGTSSGLAIVDEAS